jgi:hypothetical protein
MDTSTDHIIGELENLSVQNKYKRIDLIHTTSDVDTKISHIGHSVVKTLSYNISLSNICLYIPNTSKSSISIHRLTKDNSTHLEFYHDVFFYQRSVHEETLINGHCHQGLYLVPSSRSTKKVFHPTQPFPSSPSTKQVFHTIKPSFSKWHSRSGHASVPIVENLINRFSLS